MAFFSDQRERLLRASWAPDALAQELYAMMATDLPVSTNSPLEIKPAGTLSQAPLQIGNITDGQQIISIKRQDGSNGGSILYYETGPVFVPPGGKPVPLVCCKHAPTGKLKLVQKTEGDFSGTLFTDNVSAGDLLIAFVQMYSSTGNAGSNTPATATIQDSLGNIYTQAGPYVTYSGPFTWTVGGVDQGPFNTASAIGVFYCISNASGPCTITGVAVGDVGNGTIISAFEFSGISPTSTLVGVSSNLQTQSNTTPPTGTFTSLPVSSTSGGLVIGISLTGGAAITNLAAGFVEEFGPETSFEPWIIADKINSGASEEYSGDGTMAQFGPGNDDGVNPLPTEYAFLTIAASFRPA